MSDSNELRPADLVANWNGSMTKLSEVTVSVLDRGFLFGDAVYEVIRVYGGRLFRLEDHLARLKDSLNSLEIEAVDLDTVRKRLEETTSKSGLKRALAYLQVTRGEALRSHHYPDACTANILIYLTPFDNPHEKARKEGVSAVTHPDIRWRRNDIKATSLAANCMGAQYARKQGAFEVIFIDSAGFMTEGSHTSMFGIKGGKLLVAPASANVLPGITKRQVLELAEKSGVQLDYVRIKAEEIETLDELFLAGTPEELIPITKVDGKAIGDGKPGPLFKRLYEAFSQIVEEYENQPA